MTTGGGAAGASATVRVLQVGVRQVLLNWRCARCLGRGGVAEAIVRVLAQGLVPCGVLPVLVPLLRLQFVRLLRGCSLFSSTPCFGHIRFNGIGNRVRGEGSLFAPQSVSHDGIDDIHARIGQLTIGTRAVDDKRCFRCWSQR